MYMRKTVLLLCALMAAVAAQAAAPVCRQVTDSVIGNALFGNFNMFDNSRLATRASGDTQTPWMDMPEVLESTPEGTQKMYSRAGDGTFVLLYQILDRAQDNKALLTVVAPDGKTVYMQDPISNILVGSWVKGTIDGDKLRVPLLQGVYYSESEGRGLVTGVGKYYEYEEDGKTYIDYAYDPTFTEVVFNIGKDGTLTIEDTFLTENTDDMPPYIYTLFDNTGARWNGYADWNSVYTPLNDVVTTFPDGAEVSDYVVKCSDGTADLYKVGFKDNNVYILGLATDPDAAIAGQIDGDKIVFPAGQYVGIKDGYLDYFYGLNFTVEKTYDEENDSYKTKRVYTMPEIFAVSYDTGTKKLVAADDQAFVITRGKIADISKFSRVKVYPSPEFTPYYRGSRQARHTGSYQFHRCFH